MQWLSFRNRQLEAVYHAQFAAIYRTMDMTVIVVNLLLTVSWLGKYGRHGLPRFELFTVPTSLTIGCTSAALRRLSIGICCI